MNATDNPRRLARIAGVFYLLIHVMALFAYKYVRGELVVAGDMKQTANNILAHEQLFRMGIAASVIVAMANLPMGYLLCELCKVVNRRVAQLALLFIVASSILEAGNPINYFETLVYLKQPEIVSAFQESQRLALARAAMRMFGLRFSVSLSFFGVFCVLIGYLMFRSRFLPAFLGVLMALGGVSYLINGFTTFLALPDVPHIFTVTLIAETALLLWLLVFGVNDAKWRERAAAVQ
jgi:uncharacterized protein DUF4386